MLSVSRTLIAGRTLAAAVWPDPRVAQALAASSSSIPRATRVARRVSTTDLRRRMLVFSGSDVSRIAAPRSSIMARRAAADRSAAFGPRVAPARVPIFRPLCQ